LSLPWYSGSREPPPIVTRPTLTCCSCCVRHARVRRNPNSASLFAVRMMGPVDYRLRRRGRGVCGTPGDGAERKALLDMGPRGRVAQFTDPTSSQSLCWPEGNAHALPSVLASTHFTEGNRKIATAGNAALMAASIFLSRSRAGMGRRSSCISRAGSAFFPTSAKVDGNSRSCSGRFWP